MSKVLYTTHATATGGRGGRAETDDKSLSFTLSTPGSGKSGANPEQLFACGYAACFGGAVAAVVKKMQLEIGEPQVTAGVNLNQDDSGGYFISVTLDVSLPDLDAASASNLVNAAHQVCPYSKATRNNIDVKLSANGQMLQKAA